jgi:hypothetical protein
MHDSMMHEIERATHAPLRRGEVVEITESETIVVTLDGDGASVRCDLLATTEAPGPILVAGDRVLTWVPIDGAPVVVGRIGPTRGAAAPQQAPETLTIEATQSLTLRVGDGSITIREDGKILIKGKDLVSHAQRMNRIKGGAVSIN